MNFKIEFSVTLYMLLILSGSTLISSQINPKALIDVAKFGWKAIQALITIESSINNHKFQQNVINALDEIRTNTARIESLITSEADRIIKVLSVKIDMEIVKDFIHIVYKINTRFEKQFLRYFTGNNTYQPQTIDNYINVTINPNEFGKTLSLIHEYIVPHNYIHVNNKRVFEVLHQYMEIRNGYYINCKNYGVECINGESDYDLIFKVFNLAITSISKGYAMIVHAYKYLQLNSMDPNAWKSELRDALTDYKQTVLQIANAARAISEIESKTIRRYDPITFIEGENYESFQFLSTIITDPRLLEHKQWYLDQIPRSRRTVAFCHGYLFDCIYDNDIKDACLAPLNSKRRYEYVVEIGGNLQTYYKGRVTKNCEKDWGVMLNYNHGNTRFEKCICQEYLMAEKSMRFNLSAQFSDFFHTNRVITGIRLVTKMSITYFEIQQGVLVNGTVDHTTVSWDDRISKSLDYMKENKILPPHFVETTSFPFAYSYRRLNLDDIILPEGWVVVGVQFMLTTDYYFSFQVAGIRIFDDLGNYAMSHDPHWFEPIDSTRSELTQKDQDIPTMCNKPNQELGSPGSNYVKFQMTGWWIDASQTIYPFIDTQEVFTNPPMPIGGVGLYYKSHPGYGGFIAPKVISMNNNIFMSDNYLNTIFNNSNY